MLGTLRPPLVARLRAPGWRRAAAAAAVVAVLLPVYWWGLRDPAVGLYHDDGIYAVTAKALAEGRGYRIVSLPEEPPQTKYPIVFPFLLSLVWRVFPAFPQNLFWLKLAPFLSAVVWLWLSYRLLAGESKNSCAAPTLVLLTAASGRIVLFSTTLLSETLFAALATGALLLLRGIEQGDQSRSALAASAVLATAAFLTRTAIPGAIPLFRTQGAARRGSESVSALLLAGSGIESGR
ncbi:MAG: hypothetical protein FJW37_13295 [Acidobacteria bacterium]|nr:hypothetical protein [Acidobacteriota bacterium]